MIICILIRISSTFRRFHTYLAIFMSVHLMHIHRFLSILYIIINVMNIIACIFINSLLFMHIFQSYLNSENKNLSQHILSIWSFNQKWAREQVKKKKLFFIISIGPFKTFWASTQKITQVLKFYSFIHL